MGVGRVFAPYYYSRSGFCSPSVGTYVHKLLLIVGLKIGTKMGLLDDGSGWYQEFDRDRYLSMKSKGWLVEDRSFNGRLVGSFVSASVCRRR